MTEKPSTTAMRPTTRSLVIPTASKRGLMRCETAGSPTQPRARDATVIPTWQTERLESRSRSVARAAAARALPSCSSCTRRDSRTRTSANSAATKKAFRPTRTRATRRLNEDKRDSGTSTHAQRGSGLGIFVGGVWRQARPSRYGPDYTAAHRPHKYHAKNRARPVRSGPVLSSQLSAVSSQLLANELTAESSSSHPFGFVLAQEALEEATVALLVVQDIYDHVVRDRVYVLGLLDDVRVVLDRAVFGIDDALYDVHDIDLVLRWLELVLAGFELHRARNYTVKLLDARSEELGVPELLLNIFLYVLLDLLGPHAVGVDGVGDVVHDRFQLHKIRRLEQLDDGLAPVRHLLRKDTLA